MFGDCPEDEELRGVWRDFCAKLSDAGELVFADSAPAAALDRAEGLRFISRNIPLALAFEMENNDPLHPELMRYFHPTLKQGGDNGDAVYLGAPIDGRHRYRISGRRGDARYLAFTVVERGDTPWGGAVAGSLFKDQLRCDADGDFELLLGPEAEAEAPNFIQTSADTFRVTIRQFFADWENEAPMQARIDCLAEDVPPPPAFDPARLRDGLGAAADWLQWSTRYWAEKLDMWRRRPNEFIAFGEMEQLPIDATPGGTPLICYWELPPEEALIARVTPPACEYWNCEFGSWWFTTMDYRYRLSGTNCHHAALEEDGSLIVVASAVDPGVPNWLDTAGHRAGYVTFRWIGGEERPRPVCRQLPLAELDAALPENRRTIDPDARRRQLLERRRGVCNRFRV